MSNRLKAPDPGIYENIPFDTYCRWDAVNNSSLGSALRSTLHYVSHLSTVRETTDAFRFGSMAHSGVLEPAQLLNQYVTLPSDFGADIKNTDGSTPKNIKATKAYKDKLAKFKETNSGKEIIDQSEFERLASLISSVAQHKRASGYLRNRGAIECSMVWVDEETGLLCKGRMDHYCKHQKRITDLKTTRDAAEFNKSIANFGYDRQAAFYMDGLRALGKPVDEFCIVAVESEAPFAVRAAPIHEDTIEDGRRLYREALARVAEWRSTYSAAGYEDPDYWQKPTWAFESNNEIQLTFQGEALKL